MNRDLGVLAIILSPTSPRFERLFWRPKIASLEGHFGFLAQNAANHVQIMANTVWIVIYALTRSFWAQTQRDLGEFFGGPKFSPWSAILRFWPETLEIMYKTLLILSESWSTRSRDHFEPKFALIWETFLTAQNWLLGGPFCVFGPKRWKSCANHGKYCMNRDLRVDAIILSPTSPRFERLSLTAQNWLLRGLFWVFDQNAGNNVQIMAIIVWIVI